MDRDQLVDLTRRAFKLARDDATDLAAAEYTVRADSYTSAGRLERDVAMLNASPQLVGYTSELPAPGSYCTKTVMGRSIVLTRVADGSVKAFDNVCLHRQAQIVTAAVPRNDSPARTTHGPTTTPDALSACLDARGFPRSC